MPSETTSNMAATERDGPKAALSVEGTIVTRPDGTCPGGRSCFLTSLSLTAPSHAPGVDADVAGCAVLEVGTSVRSQKPRVLKPLQTCNSLIGGRSVDHHGPPAACEPRHTKCNQHS